MLDFILLGQIPGTEHYINFTEYILIVSALLLSWLIYRQKQVVKYLLLYKVTIQLPPLNLSQIYRSIISVWKVLNVTGKASLLRFVNR